MRMRIGSATRAVLLACLVTICFARRTSSSSGSKKKRALSRSGDDHADDCPWAGPESNSSERKRAGLERLQAGDGGGAVACLRSGLHVLEREREQGMGTREWAQEKGEIGVGLGDALEMVGDRESSAQQFESVMEEFPTSPIPPFKLGNQHREAERWHDAISMYTKAVSLAPSFVNARVNLGMSYRGTKDLDKSIECYQDAIKIAPSRADVHVNLGVALDAAGKPEKAREAYEAAILLNPLQHQAYFNLGVVLWESLGEKDASIKMYHKALEIDPLFPDAYHTLGTAHTSLGKYAQAKAYLDKAVSLRPNDGRFINSIGILADVTGDADGAYRAYTASAEMSASPAALINAAKVMNSQLRSAEAEQLCFRAISMDPSYGEAYCQLGDVYKDGEQIQAALEAYQQGIQLSPGYDAGFCNFFYAATFACHWEGRAASVRKLRQNMARYLRGSDPLAHECVQPFQSLAYPLEPEELLEIARFHANKALTHIKGITGPSPPYLPHPTTILSLLRPSGGPVETRLRVGWVSADYKDHPVVKDLVHMFSMFEQGSFDTFCFALNPEGGGLGWEETGWNETGRVVEGGGGGPGPHRVWRDKAKEHCSMIDLSGVSDLDAAKQINEQRMHILFNIQGYTQGERNEIFALEAAPIQVLYKGFVGTLGASYVGHMVSDRLVSPPEYASHFTEKFVYMPHTYVVNDYREWHAETKLGEGDKSIERENFQLPSWPRVIYCNFNQQYKIDAPTLRAWVQILGGVPDSVLWLLRFGTSDAAEVSIRKEAEKLGLKDAEKRIVFTDPVPRRIHLHVKTLAHIFIDTPQYNGHGTATDALWAKIPLITFPVRKMASRAAASFAVASGSGLAGGGGGGGRTTIVRNLKDYVQVAIQLGRQESSRHLEYMRADLEATRFTSPMFDTRRWVKEFEKACRMLWETAAPEAGSKSNVVLSDLVPPT